jgi:hypothetical protein
MYDLLLEGKISFVRTCDGEEIKATNCIMKVAITRGNIKWRSFPLRACTSKNKKRMTTSTSLCEGPIFYFSVFTFMQALVMFIPIPLYLFSSGQASCGREWSRHIYPVEYRWSWVIIVDIIPEINKLGGKTLSPYLPMCLTEMVSSKNMLLVSAIMEGYMIVEYVEFAKSKLLHRPFLKIRWIAIVWWLRTSFVSFQESLWSML